MRKTNSMRPSTRIFLHGMLLQNPILVQVIGLCPAVAAAANLYVSALLSILVTILLLLCECIACLMLKKIPRRIRIAIYFILGLLVCAETAFFLEQNVPDLREQAGVYLPLMAASSLVALRCEKIAVKQTLRISFLDALANGLGASMVLLFSGLLRGLLGSGTIGDWTVFHNPPLRGLAMPFGGFLMLGFMAAFLKWFISVALGQNVQMAFGIQRRRKAPAVVQTQTAAPQTAAAPKAEPANAQAVQPADAETAAASGKKTPVAAPEFVQSEAEAFYDEASDDPSEELPDDLFTSLDLSVEQELQSILDSIGELGEGDDGTDA